MKPGRLTPQNMHVLAPREPPFRPAKTTEQLRIIELEHQVEVMKTAILGYDSWAAFVGGAGDNEATRTMRLERARLKAAGIKIQGVNA